jgi:hypothetical protein
MTAYYANDNSSETPQPKPSRIKAYHAYVAVAVLSIAFTATYRTMTAQKPVDGNWVISACLTPNGIHHDICHDHIVEVSKAVTLIGYEGRKACPPSDINPDQMHDDIAVNLSYNPDLLNRSADSLIAAAVIKAFPCRLNDDQTRAIE